MNEQPVAAISIRRASSENAEYLAYGKIAEAVESCLAAGHEPDVEVLAAQYPELADQIRQLVPAFVTLRQIHSAGDSADDPRRVDGLDRPPLGQLGDFSRPQNWPTTYGASSKTGRFRLGGPLRFSGR